MRKSIPILIILTLVFSLGTSHAAVSLNMQFVTFNGAVCPDLTPSLIQNAYGFTSLYAAGLEGNGENIAIIVAHGDPNLISDLDAFDSAYNLPTLTEGKNLLVENPFGIGNFNSQNWTSETALDVEVIHSLAPDANIYLVVSPNDSFLFNATQYAIQDLPVNTISISWGASEETYSTSTIDSQNSVLQLAAEKGISVFAASGDSGAYNSYNTLNVNFPASSPYVISVGGTVLTTSPSGTYEGEDAWSDGGGGESQFFAKPSPQPNISDSRMVPDVSFNAGTPVCAYVNGSWGGYYGTSVAAPSWAALDALINQKIKGSGALSLKSLYDLYYQYGYTAFNSIDRGNNGFYYADGSYNMATGIGSPKAYELVQLLSDNYQRITFNSTDTNTVFEINGANYTSPLTLNFSYGEQVTVKAFSTEETQYKRYTLSSYTGIINSSNQTITFSATSGGYISSNFNAQFSVLENYVDGYLNTSQFVTSGSSIAINSIEQYQNDGASYSLVGFRVDDGPIIYESSGSIPVDSQLNITFIWNRGATSTFSFLDATANSNIQVSYLNYVPLSNSTADFIETVSNDGSVSVIPGSKINYSGRPEYAGGYRYVVQNATLKEQAVISPLFIEESKYGLNLLSSSGVLVYPSQITVKSGSIIGEFQNSTVWAPTGSQFELTSIVFGNNVFNVLKTPLTLYPNSSNYNVSLAIGNVIVSLGLYFGIPVIAAKVNFIYSNLSLSNSTGVNGITTFYDVPDSNYNLTVNAYGSSYSYSSLKGTSQTLQVNPLMYQLYILVAIISLILLVFVIVEIRRHKLKNARKSQ